MKHRRPEMDLRDGKTLLFLTVNGGFLFHAIEQIKEQLPKLVQACGNNLYVAFGEARPGRLFHHSIITKVLENDDEDALFKFISAAEPCGGGTYINDINEILKGMVNSHDYQDVDNLIFMGSFADIPQIDTDARLWIARRKFMVVAMDEFHSMAEDYFKSIKHTLYGGKIYHMHHLTFMLQFAQLQK